MHHSAVEFTSSYSRASPNISINDPPGLGNPGYLFAGDSLYVQKKRASAPNYRENPWKHTVINLKPNLFVVARLPSNIPAVARGTDPPHTDMTYLAPGAWRCMKSISSLGVLSAPVLGSGKGPRLWKKGQLLASSWLNQIVNGILTSRNPNDIILLSALKSVSVGLGGVNSGQIQLAQPMNGVHTRGQILEFKEVRQQLSLHWLYSWQWVALVMRKVDERQYLHRRDKVWKGDFIADADGYSESLGHLFWLLREWEMAK